MAADDIVIPVNVPMGGERGDIPDHQLDANFFRLLQNWHIDTKGQLTLRDGYEPLASSGPGTRILGLAHFKNEDGTSRTVASTPTKLYSYDSTSWTDRTATVMTASNVQLSRWQVFAESGTVKIIHVNEKDVVQIGTGAANFADLGGTPPTLSLDVIAVANRVLLLKGPDNIRISDFNNSAVWPSLLSVRLVDTGDNKLGMARLGKLNAFVVYGEQSQIIGRAQSGSFPFRFDTADEKPGPLSKAAVIPDGNIHYYLGTDGVVYKVDGVNVIPWHRGMQDYVNTDLNFDNRKMSHGLLIRKYRLIFWFFPKATATAPNAGVYLDIDRRSMGRLLFGEITASSQWQTVALITWANAEGTWANNPYSTWDSVGGAAQQREMLGDSAGQVHAYGSGKGSDDGAAIEGIWEMPLRPWAGPDKNFIPRAFEEYYKKTISSVTITPATRVGDTLMEDPALVNHNAFDISTDQRNSVDLASATEAEGKRFMSIRNTVSTATEGGNVKYVGGVLFGSPTEASEGPTV